MFDAKIRSLIDPPLNAAGRRLARFGITANMLTSAGLLFGLSAALAISQGEYLIGLALVLLNRLCDGLDGALARATRPSDFGGYFDILADFTFYVAVPLGFGFANPANLTFAMLLIASFTLTGISFLAYAVMAAKSGRETSAHGTKSFFYSSGIAEGSETIITFIAMCLFPKYFGAIALLYALLCLITVIQRSIAARRDFD